jgi:hypothetical protein
MSTNDIIDSKILLARDYSSLMEWSINTIPKITSEWTDFSVTATEMIWLSTACYCYDILNFSLDRKYLDNQIRYSNSFENILNMCTLRGVIVPGYMSSTTTLKIVFTSTDLPPTNSLTLSKGDTFEVLDTISQKTLTLNIDEDYTLSYGDNFITCSEGILTSKTLKALDFTAVGTYILDTENIALNTVEVEVNGTLWRKVDDATLVTDNVPSFSVHVNANKHTLLKLTPGFIYDVVDNLISVSYLITNGSQGNLGTIRDLEPKFNFIDSYGNNVFPNNITISVVTSSGGSDIYSIEEVRSLLGTTSSDVITLVLNEDYSDLVKTIKYVYGCSIQDVGGTKTIYYIADKDIGTYGVTDSMIISGITDKIQNKVPVFTSFTVLPILLRSISVSITVYLNRNELDTSGIRDKIIDYFYNTFSRSTVVAGKEFNRSELSIGIESLSSSIDHILFQYPLSNIPCKWNEIIEIDSEPLITFERG